MAALRRVFRDRHLLVRSEHGVGHVFVKSHHQWLAACATGLVLVWSLTATVGVGLAGQKIASLSRQIQDFEIGYADLITHLAQRGGDVAQLAERFADSETVAERVIQRNVDLEATIRDLEGELARRQAEQARLGRTSAGLLEQVRTLEEQVAASGKRAARQARVIGSMEGRIAQLQVERQRLVEHRSALRDEILSLETDLADSRIWSQELERKIVDLNDAAEDAYRLADRRQLERDTLRETLAGLDRQLAEARDHRAALEARLEQEQVIAGRYATERDRLAERIGELTDRIDGLHGDLARLRGSQAGFLADLRERSASHVSHVEDALAFTGLDIDSLIVRLAKDYPVALGGPISPDVPDAVANEDAWSEADNLVTAVSRAADLRALANRLPIGMPLLDGFNFSSGFGSRRDPFTGRRSRHYGLDMAAPTRTIVHATAPGSVTFAGWLGAYGNLVEIEHGLGLVTRYAHLHSSLVEVGDRVEHGDRIGLVGSTGRSTGPHLHYEVRVNGEPRDPANFLRAGEHVFEIASQ